MGSRVHWFSIKYFISINGHLSKCFYPQRGLQQGDHFSPYLFLLCTEGLNGFIKREVDNGSLRGVVMFGMSPVISHLFFVDGSLFFLKGGMQEVRVIQSLRNAYELAQVKR